MKIRIKLIDNGIYVNDLKTAVGSYTWDDDSQCHIIEENGWDWELLDKLGISDDNVEKAVCEYDRGINNWRDRS